MKMYSRTHPYLSYIRERELLTASSSTKRTYHVVLDTQAWEGGYKVGDSIGVLPMNDPKEVDLILEKMGCSGEEEVFDHRANTNLSFRRFLLYRANLMKINRSLVSSLVEKGVSRLILEPLLKDENKGLLHEFLHANTVKDLVHMGPFTPLEIAKAAMPLLPRFYSIANSPRVFPGEIHLLVAYVQYHLNGQTRHGVGSHFLCDLALLGSTEVPIYVQPSNHFTLPEDPDTSIILIGAGTGIAPYRAFLQERVLVQARGRNWLFFGERNQRSDFYYESFWSDLEKQGRLRLDLAFSRDGSEKNYVQHKMYERKKSLWQWIEEGSYIYLCGNAEYMAKDVDLMLHRIVREEGNLSEEGAIEYIKRLRQNKRFLLDVY